MTVYDAGETDCGILVEHHINTATRSAL